MRSLIDTDIKNNVGHVRSHLGILLVVSMALGFVYIVHSATSEFADTLAQSNITGSVLGELKIRNSGNVRYGDTIRYRSRVDAEGEQTTERLFVTTVCYQDETMVFERSAHPDVGVHLYDQIGAGLEWDGGPAACSATLMLQSYVKKNNPVTVIDSLGFEVGGSSL